MSTFIIPVFANPKSPGVFRLGETAYDLSGDGRTLEEVRADLFDVRVDAVLVLEGNSFFNNRLGSKSAKRPIDEVEHYLDTGGRFRCRTCKGLLRPATVHRTPDSAATDEVECATVIFCPYCEERPS